MLNRVIVCKLGRLGELRKVLDSNVNQLYEDGEKEDFRGEKKENKQLENFVKSSNNSFPLTNMVKEKILEVSMDKVY